MGIFIFFLPFKFFFSFPKNLILRLSSPSRLLQVCFALCCHKLEMSQLPPGGDGAQGLCWTREVPRERGQSLQGVCRALGGCSKGWNTLGS